jgi:hypothetical protein
MRCPRQDERRGALFSYVDRQDRVPEGHPRLIRRIVNEILTAVDGVIRQVRRQQTIATERPLPALRSRGSTRLRAERHVMSSSTTICCPTGSSDAGSTSRVDSDHEEPGTTISGGGPYNFLAALLDHKEARNHAVGRTLLGRQHAGAA